MALYGTCADEDEESRPLLFSNGIDLDSPPVSVTIVDKEEMEVLSFDFLFEFAQLSQSNERSNSSSSELPSLIHSNLVAAISFPGKNVFHPVLNTIVNLHEHLYQNPSKSTCTLEQMYVGISSSVDHQSISIHDVEYACTLSSSSVQVQHLVSTLVTFDPHRFDRGILPILFSAESMALVLSVEELLLETMKMSMDVLDAHKNVVLSARKTHEHSDYYSQLSILLKHFAYIIDSLLAYYQIDVIGRHHEQYLELVSISRRAEEVEILTRDYFRRIFRDCFFLDEDSELVITIAVRKQLRVLCYELVQLARKAVERVDLALLETESLKSGLSARLDAFTVGFLRFLKRKPTCESLIHKLTFNSYFHG
jgi:hypothetical protein